MAAAAFSPARQGLHIWAILTLAATFFLLCSGGIVTSKGVGMSVPDWPTTYGYNMFLFPISRWVGGIFYEHAHRLIASGVGLMTMILAGWMLASEPRRWVKMLGIVAFVGVCIQGLLGGLRVTLYKDEIGIFHALLAQAFFCLIGILTVVTSRKFVENRWDVLVPDGGLRHWALGATVLIFLQLGLGATMRHEHAGLAIKDFPLAYGAVIPDTSAEAIARINVEREAAGEMPTNAEFIWVQMAHRAVAVLIVVAVGVVTWRAFHFANARVIRGWSVAWAACVAGQIVLGAWTIWSNKAADIATSHMALGALTLLLGVVFCFRLFRSSDTNRFRSPNPQPLPQGVV
ncbi:MAG: COX15/CtaA family protein [Terrimicrobiaceae bacterium]|nr:COX15/CtaA family protein [Terrimicrobiaceae bacterium]